MRSLSDGLYVVEQLSVNPPGPDGEPRVNPASYGPMPQLVVSDDDGTRIDVMVVYTAAARSAWGGTPAILTQINTAISETNTGYANSQITQRVKLVHTAEVPDADFPESSDWGLMLNQLSYTDTYADYIQTWRDTYKADEVVMLTSRTEWCGLAWLMTGSNYSVFTNGYSLVATGCATGYYSFAHEMGHNEGAHHDRVTVGGGGAGFSANYSYGYWMAGGVGRTIMAYTNGSPRVNYWSNPNVLYLGQATGAASNPSTGADNHLTLNNTAIYAARFKDGVAAAPSSLVKQASAANQVKIGWTRNTTDETHTYVERSSPSAPTWTQIADLGNGSITYTDTNPVCLETNQYRVKIKNGNGISTYSNTLSVDTCLPTSQLAAAGSQERINLSWVDNANNNGITRVERSPNGSTGWVEVGQIIDSTSLFASQGLTCATPYYYRLKLQNWFGYFVYSTNMTAITSACGVPQLPTGLRAVGKTTQSLTVQWNDIDGETSYILERSANGTTGWAVVGTLNKDVNAFMNSGLAANTPYYYRLKSHNASGDSAYTTNLAATTLTADVMYVPLVNR